MSKNTNATFKQTKNIPVIRQLIQDEKKQIRKLNTVMDRAERQDNKKEKQDCQKQKKERQKRIGQYQKTIDTIDGLWLLSNRKQLRELRETEADKLRTQLHNLKKYQSELKKNSLTIIDPAEKERVEKLLDSINKCKESNSFYI